MAPSVPRPPNDRDHDDHHPVPAGIPIITPAPAVHLPNQCPRRTTRPPRRLIASTAAMPVRAFGEDPSTFLTDMGEHILQEAMTDPIAFSATSDLHSSKWQCATRSTPTKVANIGKWSVVLPFLSAPKFCHLSGP
ncbi:hypothetical protein MHU86_10340 [Fragilaria crotonensis]|nr:hypothetical protein MHU86_10340 [Fragilaria crotonensis]